MWCTFLSILIPILFFGTMKLGKISGWHIFQDILRAIIHPIMLHYQLTVAKLVRMKLLKQQDRRYSDPKARNG